MGTASPGEARGVPWDVTSLEIAPKTYPAPGIEAEGLRALFYEGLPYEGRATRVFAWYGAPAHAAGEEVPAMVLVHGGGGTAFEAWVRLWNSRGYAAIAMDTCGCIPVGTYGNWSRHEFGGPAGWGGFEHIDEPVTEQWTYHAVADVLLAHSLLRSFPEVDAERIGITGISWGGYLTCIAAGIDARFRFAAPVYGCGFLGEDSAWLDQFAKMGPEKAAKWLGLWDPSVYLGRAAMPMLWVTGSNDFAYPMDSLQHSYRLPSGPRTLCVRLRMPHGHGGAGENPEEIHAFADCILNKGVPLARITGQGREGMHVWATFTAVNPLAKAELNYTKDRGKWQERTWESLPARLDAASGEVSATLPEGATTYYLNVSDERGLVVSSEHEELPGEDAPTQRPDDSALQCDWRNIRFGKEIPSEGYCDQPYVVVMEDGRWLCVMTTGSGLEGETGQHVVSTATADHGTTWTPLVDIEPAGAIAASWAMPLLTPAGRVYAFYVYNGDKVDRLGDKENIRSDTLGWYCYRYTDDGGVTWSDRRYRLPMRATAVDRGNDWGGAVQIFWGIGKPVSSDGSAIFAFSKIGRYMLDDSEGWFFRSDNVLSEPDPEKIAWELLPEGEQGLRNPTFGSIQAEQNIVPLDGGGLYCMYRTTTGYPCHAYSRDGGRTWTLPEHATYTPGGKRMKNPRACPRIWRTANGHYLFWFHNHSGKDFLGRNPAWISGGVAIDGYIHWSQPEILLYDPECGDAIGRGGVRMSYPDLIEQDGEYYVTETQKSIARVHAIDRSLLEGLWAQCTAKEIAREGLALALGPEDDRAGIRVPEFPSLHSITGFSIELWFELSNTVPGQVLLDARDINGKGVALLTAGADALEIRLSDGGREGRWACDAGLVTAAERHHVVATVDSSPRIITFVIDGVLCDGGEQRQFGWGRFPAELGDVNGADTLTLAPGVRACRIYTRYLRTSEAVGNFHAGL